MNFETYFPRGLATGAAFCNRKLESKRLMHNIDVRHHTLIMSPRRYGKTSLAKYVVAKKSVLFGDADLFIAIDAPQIENLIVSCVNKMMSEISTSVEQTLEIVRQYFKKINANWNVGTQGINISLTPDKNQDVTTIILEALQALETVLAKKNIPGVIFIDEIQEIGEVAEGKGIEGAIRHVAQETKYLSFIFSGSNRHLLAKMFYDKARPLYKLCDRIVLERIDASHYRKHLNILAKKYWGENLSDATIEKIFLLTERHPYYMNTLCLNLWSSDLKKTPDIFDIEFHWLKMVKEERQDIMRELSTLSMNQRKILLLISTGYTTELTGKDFLKRVDMTGSSVIEAIRLLESKDYIEKMDDGKYHLIDPLIATALRFYLD